MTPWGGLVKMTVWLIVVLLMVIFLYTMLTAQPASGASPASGSPAEQICATAAMGAPPVTDTDKPDDRACLEEFSWDR